MKDGTDDDFKLRGYQDDLDTDADDYDPVMSEQNDNPAELLGVPPDELKDEFNKYDLGDNGEREFIEKQDEETGQGGER